MKKYIKFFLVLLAVIVMPIKSYATELDSLDMQVKLMDNGDAVFTNTFTYDDDEGTEHFFKIDGMDSSEVKDFTVTRNGKPMENIGEWSVGSSFEEKAGKYGIVQNGSNYELCYGITSYEKNTFVLSYTVTNIVKQLNDSQMLYWEFLSRNYEDYPKSVSITIGKEGYGFDYSNSKIWAFGYRGNIEFVDGNIVAKVNGSLPTGNKVTILTKFDEPIFTPSHKLEHDFMYYKEMAFEGSDYDINVEEGTGGKSVINSRDKIDGMSYKAGTIMSKFMKIFAFLIAFLVPFSFFRKYRNARKEDSEAIDIDEIIIRSSNYKKQYYREIPYDGDLTDLYMLFSNMKVTTLQNYISACFLKWIKDGKLISEKQEADGLFSKGEITFKIVDKDYEPKDYFERRLFGFLKETVNETRVVDSKKFGKWIKKNGYRVENLEERSFENSKIKLKELGYLTEEIEIRTFSKVNKTVLSPKGEELVGNIIKFGNYLKEYSLLNERDSFNVHLWDEFMIFAALLGITEEVEKEFKNIYPKYVDESFYDAYTVYYVTRFATRANESFDSTMYSSSGGGGGSSFGGGGGSFGGGGGGTR